ncbi:MAG: trimethylamine methyltransferase family protein, partial [Aestuariivirgaceae bacterium]
MTSNSGDKATTRRKRAGRKRQPDIGAAIDQRAWRQPKRHFKPVDLISQDHLEAIHLTSLKVLEDCGLEIVNDEACEILRKAGARIDGHHVRIGAEIIDEGLKTVPAKFTFHARNPAHDLIIGGDHVAFAPVGGPPNCSDMDRGRRPGTFEDAKNFIRLSQYFNTIHLAG